MGVDHWPLTKLRLRTADLVLRPMVEADLQVVTETLPDDVTLDPTLPRFEQLSEPEQRGVNVRQGYWRALGHWSVDAWALSFVVLAGERIVGVQALEGEDFLVLRTVDSFSHLAVDVRGRGWGKQSRRAVLALAFGPLGAEAAVTSAWHDNRASIGVSRALGYADNGVTRQRSDQRPGADTMAHFRLVRSDWQSSGQAASVRIDGFEGCEGVFGLPS